MGTSNLQELSSDFIKHLHHQGKSTNTIKNYQTDLNCFLDYYQQKKSNTKLRDFTASQALEYGEYVNQRYDSENSRRRKIQALRLFFDYLIGQHQFLDNPIRKIPNAPKFLDTPHPTEINDILKLYENLHSPCTSELERLIQLRGMILFYLIFEAGLKVSDLVGLNFDNFLESEEGLRVLIRHPKKDPYSIPLPKSFIAEFESYKELYKKIANEHEVEVETIFFNANAYKILKGKLSARGIEIIFKELSKKLEIHLTPKSLRQSCIYLWISKGHSDTQIKEWLGLSPSYSMKMYLKYKEDFPMSDEFLKVKTFN